MRIPLLCMTLAALLVVAGCGADRGRTGSPPPADPDVLRGKTFTAEKITERGEALALVTGTGIELRFTDDGRLLANAGCNLMSGTVTQADNRLDIADLSVTEMGCDPPRHDQDRWLSDFLGATPAWRFEGENLVLNAAETELVLAPQQTRSLQDTAWTVSTLVDGQVAGSLPAGVTATLVFDKDKATVTGLCNLHEVTYRADGPTLTFALGRLTRKMCDPAIMTVENAAVAVLDGETTYELDGNTLTLTNGDRGLQLVAD